MPEPSETIVVPRALEALMPKFLANRGNELDALRAALAAEDFAELRTLAHRMKGVGASYGFERVSTYGAQIEAAAEALDRAVLAARIEAYAEHLQNLRIVYD